MVDPPMGCPCWVMFGDNTARSGCSFWNSAMFVEVFKESDSPLIASRIADSLSSSFTVVSVWVVVSVLSNWAA